MTVEEDVQAAAERGDIVIGTEETVKTIESVDTVVLASNAPADLVEAVRDAATDADVDLVRADVDNRQLGSLCMEPFSASVVGIR